MKASTQYSDLKGTAAADIHGATGVNKFEYIANHIGLDKTRFEVIGVRLNHLPEISMSVLCIDKQLSTPDKPYTVDMDLENQDGLLEQIFHRFDVVLYDKFDNQYSAMSSHHEVSFSDFHGNDEE